MRPKSGKCIFYELNFDDKVWIYFARDRPAEFLNSFEEHAISLSKAILKYDNNLIMSDVDKDMKNKKFKY